MSLAKPKGDGGRVNGTVARDERITDSEFVVKHTVILNFFCEDLCLLALKKNPPGQRIFKWPLGNKGFGKKVVFCFRFVVLVQ